MFKSTIKLHATGGQTIMMLHKFVSVPKTNMSMEAVQMSKMDQRQRYWLIED
jgi:hypothetical protein